VVEEKNMWEIVDAFVREWTWSILICLFIYIYLQRVLLVKVKDLLVECTEQLKFASDKLKEVTDLLQSINEETLNKAESKGGLQ
jgi:hypothetical protein